jgi:hypothetical protein
MLKKQFTGVLLLVALQAAAEDWTASIQTVHQGPMLDGSPTSGQFSYDVRGFYEVLPVPGEAAFRKIGYGPTGREYETYPYLTSGYYTVDLAGSSDIIAWVVRDTSPGGGDNAARLFVEKQGAIQSFYNAGSPANYAQTKAYIGRASLSHDGSVVALPTTICGQSCGGQVEAWKLNSENQYEKVVSYTAPLEARFVGRAAASTPNKVVSLDENINQEITTISIYNIIDGSVLSAASEQITLTEAEFGQPGSFIEVDRSGHTVAVAMGPSRDYPTSPTPTGGITVFSKPQICVLQCGWSQKGQLIDPAPSLVDFPYADLTGQALLSKDGNTVAVLTRTECYDDEDNIVDPCHSGLITIWDFNAESDLWEERRGEGLPIAVPVPDSSEVHYANLSGFDEQAGSLGVSIVDENRDRTFTLMKVTIEESSDTGLPIWLLYEASQ